ncbi:hypothetical protein BV22DRAFT_968668, partial [Leucogyrophana mollusca]
QINQPALHRLTCHFLHDQLSPNDPRPSWDVPLAECPQYEGRISVFHSAAAPFYGPIDPTAL